jgi:hypothetical protein
MYECKVTAYLSLLNVSFLAAPKTSFQAGRPNTDVVGVIVDWCGCDAPLHPVVQKEIEE